MGIKSVLGKLGKGSVGVLKFFKSLAFQFLEDHGGELMQAATEAAKTAVKTAEVMTNPDGTSYTADQKFNLASKMTLAALGDKGKDLALGDLETIVQNAWATIFGKLDREKKKKRREEFQKDIAEINAKLFTENSEPVS